MPQRRSIFRESDPEWADKRGIGEGPRPAFGPIGQDCLGKRGSSDRKEGKIRQKSEIKRKEQNSQRTKKSEQPPESMDFRAAVCLSGVLRF